MIVIRLLLAVIILGGVATGQTATKQADGATEHTYSTIDLADFTQNPERYDGQRVSLTAEVVSISANSGSLHLFAAPSRALIEVTLGHLRRSERRALVQDPVRHVAVYGRISRQHGKIVVDADRIEPVATTFVGSD